VYSQRNKAMTTPTASSVAATEPATSTRLRNLHNRSLPSADPPDEMPNAAITFTRKTVYTKNRARSERIAVKA
jgi:hypothetical protein